MKPAHMAPTNDPADMDAVISPASAQAGEGKGRVDTYTALLKRAWGVEVVEILGCSNPSTHRADVKPEEGAAYGAEGGENWATVLVSSWIPMTWFAQWKREVGLTIDVPNPIHGDGCPRDIRRSGRRAMLKLSRSSGRRGSLFLSSIVHNVTR